MKRVTTSEAFRMVPGVCSLITVSDYNYETQDQYIEVMGFSLDPEGSEERWGNRTTYHFRSRGQSVQTSENKLHSPVEEFDLISQTPFYPRASRADKTQGQGREMTRPCMAPTL